MGSAAAGGSPVGTLLPSSLQSSSTAPTQPGHTITGDRGTWQPGQPFFQPYAKEKAAPVRDTRALQDRERQDEPRAMPPTARATP